MIVITEEKSFTNYETVSLSQDLNELIIIDQTQLPNKTEYIRLKTKEEFWEAIYKLRVRGAPAIGVAAGYSLYLCAKQYANASYEEFCNNFNKSKEYLASSRPTAVNLFWALDKMHKRLNSCNSRDIQEILNELLDEANKIKLEDIQTCKAIGEYGLSLLKPEMGLLTHCNAGSLATSRYGTALAPIYLGHERGYKFKVFADETRPLLQGARLTAYELNAAGIDTTLICDNMASIVMKNGWIDAVFVGCDRVAANGDTANKIGTSAVAVLAKNYGIPFYVCAPTSTIDFDCKTGKDITIELREPEEVTDMWYTKPMAPKGIKVYNPAFDVTDAEFITAIITEHGIAYPPFETSIMSLQIK